MREILTGMVNKGVAGALLFLLVFLTGLELGAQGPGSYPGELLERAGRKDVSFNVDKKLGHDEAFRLVKEGDAFLVEYREEAGSIYGIQALLDGDYELNRVEKPDFDIRGTTLCLMSGGGKYISTMSPEIFPWFYDRELMIRTLDVFANARMNTIFIWAGHLFPYIVEMPEYPEASADIAPEQLLANQEQFRWFTGECARRNIQVLLHFYNIHVSPPFAREHGIRTNPEHPTPLLREYTYYALSRYFSEFPSVGLYACPGESIKSEYQLEWFRDVIFKAAKDSGKDPVIVIRDWTLNMDFQQQLRTLYGNVHSELKHNDESVTSPYPDVRHLKWEGLANGHIINAAHGPAEDLQPMRWASPAFVQEMAGHWKSLGFVSGVEFWGQSFWRWPYAYDKLEKGEAGSVTDADGRMRLLYLDRDAPFYKLAGRAMWKTDRDADEDAVFWENYYAGRYQSEEIGKLMARWYTVSGSISPGLQNLNATRVANFWATLLLMNQNIDQILEYNKNLSDTPYTLYRETGRAQQRFYPRPYDAWFFQRYEQEYGQLESGESVKMYPAFQAFNERMAVDDLEQRHSMPVSQYAEYLEKGLENNSTMTPDRVVALLHILAEESLDLARQMEAACTDPSLLPELKRFVSDSRMYVLATEAMIHKENAAILKARLLLSGRTDRAEEFLAEMETSVKAYKKLASLADNAYLFANGLRRYLWSEDGIREFEEDLQKQRDWLQDFNGQKKSSM